MNEERLKQFAEQLDADSDEILARWQGRPDKIIDDLFRVRDQDTGQLRDLELFDVQRKLIHAYFYGDAGTLVGYKGRRIGYSFAIVVAFLIEALFYPDSFYPLVSRSLSQSKDRIDDIESLIDNAKVEIPTNKVNTDYIELWNGSAFMAYSADSDTSRGADSARAVLMDEMAFIEDQEKAHRAFGGFLALGKNRKMVEISTPNTKNDLFMQDFRRGQESEEVISIKQPTFANADDIDIHTPLYEQDLEPVRPEINISQLESERMRDPEGFAQEYLCRPLADEYSFFDGDRIDDAAARGANISTGLHTDKDTRARRVMGIDIGINRDDTVISVVDHANNQREQRFVEVVTDETLEGLGIKNPDRGNANHVTEYISHVYCEMDVDLVIMDSGGVGKTFERIVERKLGRAFVAFDFSDKEAVTEMMGDMNAGLHEHNVALLPNKRLIDELNAIVKEKRDHYQKPKFSGKENSESGKDDVAIATILSCYPPNNSSKPRASPQVKKPDTVEQTTSPQKKEDKPRGDRNPNYGAAKVTRGTRTRRNKYRSSKRRRR